MSPVQARMLARFSSSDRDALYFAAPGFAMAPKATAMNLASLEKAGLIKKNGKGGYTITLAGSRALSAGSETDAYSAQRICNAQIGREVLKPSAWPVRAGADDHQKYSSRGFV